jgi:hypothetical protein
VPADRTAVDWKQRAVVATQVDNHEHGGAAAAARRIVGERYDRIERHER